MIWVADLANRSNAIITAYDILKSMDDLTDVFLSM